MNQKNILSLAAAEKQEIINLSFKKATIENLLKLMYLPQFKFQRLSILFEDFEIKNVEITRINFSKRTENILRRSGIQDSLTIWNMSIRDLKDLRNSGFGTVEEIFQSILKLLIIKFDNNLSECDNLNISNNSEIYFKIDKSLPEIEHLLEFMLERLSKQDAILLKSTIAEDINYPEIFRSLTVPSGQNRSEIVTLKAKINLLSSLKTITSKVNLGVFTIDELFQLEPKFRLGVQSGYIHVSIFELLTFAGVFQSIDGYVFHDKNISYKQKSLLNAALKSSESLEQFERACKMVNLYVSDSVKKHFEQANNFQSSILNLSHETKDLRDLDGDDVWIRDLLARGGKGNIA